MKKQFRKSFVIIVTMEYQNVQASVNFSHVIKGPGMFPGLCNRPILFVSSRGTPCIMEVVAGLGKLMGKMLGLLGEETDWGWSGSCSRESWSFSAASAWLRGSNLFEEVTARIVLLDSSKLVLINLVEPELVWSRQMGSRLVLVKLVLSILLWFKKVRSKLVESKFEEEISLRLLLDSFFFLSLRSWCFISLLWLDAYLVNTFFSSFNLTTSQPAL